MQEITQDFFQKTKSKTGGLSIGIPTVGRPDTLPTVLTAIGFSLEKMYLGFNVEFVLLDEGKTPAWESFAVSQALDYIALTGAEVSVIRSRRPKGIGPARALLIESCRHDVMLMVDDDVVLTPGSLEAMIEALLSEDVAWVVPACRLIPADFAKDGYIDIEKVDPLDPRVLEWTEKYEWFVPYFRYSSKGYQKRITYSGTQAILFRRKLALKAVEGLDKLGRLPREDTYLTRTMGDGLFIAAAEALHYEHKSQAGRENWSSSVHYRLHQAAAESPEMFVAFMGEQESGQKDD